MSADRRNLQVCVLGPTGSGKSRALHELFTKRSPRVLTLDFTAEKHEQNPDVIRAFGLADTLAALTRVAGGRQWNVAAMLEPNEVPLLARILCPPIVSEDSTSFPREIGGMALECGEASLLAPSGRTAPEVVSLFTRGRHYGVSTLCGMQRISQVDLCVSSQAHVVQMFATHESADLGRIQRMFSKELAMRVKLLPQYHSLYVDKKTSRVFELDADYRPKRVTNLQGEELEGTTLPVAA